MRMSIEKRKENFQNFLENNMDQLLAIPDKKEKAKYLLGAVEFFFTKVEPTLKDVSDGEFEEGEIPIVDVTPDPSNQFGEIRVPG